MSLQIWLPMTKDLKNQGIADIEVTNYGATLNDNGKIGKCYSFNTGSYLTIDPTPMKIFNEVSIAFWVKIISWNTNYATIIDAKNGSGYSWNNEIFAVQRYSNTSRLCFNIADGSSSLSGNIGTNDLDLNTWYHVVCTYETGYCKIYQNGELVSTKATNIVPNFATIANCFIGKATEGAYQFNGYLNDMRVYDHALSPMEVKHLSQALVLHYPLDGNNGTLASPNIMPNSATMALGSANASTGTWRLAGSSNMTKTRVAITDSPIGSCYGFQNEGIQTVNDSSCYGIDSFPFETNAEYTISMWARIVSGTEGYAGYNIYNAGYVTGSHSKVDKNYYVTTLPSDGSWVRCWLNFTTNSTANRNIYIGITTGDTNVTTQMCGIKIEKGNKVSPWSPCPSDDIYTALGYDDGIEYDTSGYGNNGTKVGTLSYSTDSPRYLASAVFDGDTACIRTPYDAVAWQTNFTINLWFKKNELNGNKGYETLFGGPSGFEMDTRSGNSTTLSLYMTSTRGGNAYSPFNLGEWYMVTMVNDGTNELYYVNGELSKTIEKKNMPSGNYFIGAWSSETQQNYKGLISDFRIYATALSAEEIQKLYTVSASIDSNGNAYSAAYVEG